MNHKQIVLLTWLILSSCSLLNKTEIAFAHITPPVILISDRDAVLSMAGEAKKFFVREIKLSPEEREIIKKQVGWQADEEFYRFYLGRDDQGKIVTAVAFLIEFTIHGPVRVAVGVGPDGKVKGAKVVEMSEETYPWLKPLIDEDFTRSYIGLDSHGSFTIGGDQGGGQENMTLFYGQIVANLIQRGATLFEITVLKRGEL
jgi:hypothetical protein